MPGVVIEAGLCGVPVDATDVGMVGELVVDGESGVIVESAEPTMIAAAIERVLEDRERFGQRALEHTREHFVWDAVLPTWLDVLHRVTAPPGERSRLRNK